jgi:hypothetical protein
LLNFKIEGAEPVLYAAAPALALKLRISCEDPEERIHTITLCCQIQIEAARRKYRPDEQKRLLDLFGQPDRWDKTLRSMLWNNVQIVVPPFKGATLVDLPVACTFDFNVAAAKYFAGLESGEVPLCLLFSGSIFYEGDEGQLQVTQIPWDREGKYRLPVSVWQQMMDIYYPNSAWLSLRRDVFDRLYMYKVENGIPTWEQTVDRLLKLQYCGPEEAESSDLNNNSQFEIRNPKFLS